MTFSESVFQSMIQQAGHPDRLAEMCALLDEREGNSMSVNVPLLRKMVDRVTQELPEYRGYDHDKDREDHVWYQGSYIKVLRNREQFLEITEEGIIGKLGRLRCGTAACLAGETALETAPVGSVIDTRTAGIREPGETDFQEISQWAANKLGLSYVDRMTLFDANNRASELRTMADRIIARAETGKL
jgi:hypothetical protein